jgi:hypothetical protein
MESNNSLAPSSDIPPDVAEFCRQVELWRQTRTHREPMPEQLWTLATSLARQYTVARVSRFARLHYYTLKERVEGRVGQSTKRKEKQPAFIEVPLPLCAPSTECIVELENPCRGRMRIHVKGAPAMDLIALTRSFWSFES